YPTIGSHIVPYEILIRFMPAAPINLTHCTLLHGACRIRVTPHGRVIHCAVDQSMKLSNILEAIGHTPIIRLNRIARDCKAEVYVKADYLNPGGSVKDRIGIPRSTKPSARVSSSPAAPSSKAPPAITAGAWRSSP